MNASIEILFQDIRYGLRTLLKARGWTVIIILSLGLGIGTNTLMFSLVNGLFLRTIPVSKPESLVRFRWSGPTDLTGFNENAFSNAATGYPIRSMFSRIVFDQLRQDNQTLSDLIATTPQQSIVFFNGESQWADGLIASGNYYQELGVHALAGRLFTPEDDKPGADAVAVISYDYWKSRFAKDPKVIGGKILANDLPVTIIGVTPPDFIGIQGLTEQDKSITFPFELFMSINHFNPSNRTLYDSSWNLQLMGRLKPGAMSGQVAGNLNASFQSAAQASWAARLSAIAQMQRGGQAAPPSDSKGRVPSLVVETGKRGLFDPDAQTVRAGTILTIVVALLLLIVCANVANLLLSRATTRRNEISVRLSIGATRTRLIRQLLTESLLLAFTGGVLGLAINHWGRLLVPSFRNADVADDQFIVNFGTLPELDWRIVVFVFGLTTLTGIVFGLIPALRSTRVDLVAALKESGRSSIGRRSILSKSLVIAQVAISLTLLVGAGLFLRTVKNLQSVAIGFNPQNVMTFHVSVRALTPGDQDRLGRLYREIMQRVGNLPGVQSIAGTSIAFWQTQVVGSRPFFRPGKEEPLNGEFLQVTPGFFATMQIPLLSGRDFNETDTIAPPKVVINEIAAERLFRGENPIGQQLTMRATGAPGLQIVGVVGNTKYGDVRTTAQPTVYLPAAVSTTFVLRTAGDPMKLAPRINEIVRQVDPMVPVAGMASENDLGNGRIQTERLFAGFYVFFGSLALLLAAIGLFGLMSYNVSRRTSEIGMRMALGAQRDDVVRMIMRESLTLAGVGVAVGIVLDFAANRLIASQLYGLASDDIVTIIAATGLMLGVAALAAYLPSRHASLVDPLRALRHE